ncbi:hypothetical protein PanWU01x14_122360 [Parasponia andersonii]|uniref:Uncharacterized protein n=1 Tax=Parasponia andersonii TaxID=3476 RepID=A0A2P5CUX4_PARAD|nr:hypothetical protein PanWU01x14_122360 [Parasponia andersonii]
MPTQEEVNPDPVEVEEINDGVNIGASRGVTSTHVVESSNQETASKGAINCGTSLGILPSSNELDVQTEVSPTMSW